MTEKEFIEKYSKMLYENNTEECFCKVRDIIENVEYNKKPIDLDTKIRIWKQIEKCIKFYGNNDSNLIFEHEITSMLTLINLTLKSLELDKGE